MRIALFFGTRGTSPNHPTTRTTFPAVDALASTLARIGHEVERVDGAHPTVRVVARLDAIEPDLVILLTDRAGAKFDHFAPALCEELNLPWIGPDTATLGLLLEKLAKGTSMEDAVRTWLRSACQRCNLPDPDTQGNRRPRKALRVGLTFNLRRDTSDDAEAEFDPPTTIEAIHKAIEGLGHTVVPLEADGNLPTQLQATAPDVVFNIAEGLRGRGREAQVPALCEMLGIPYTGSDPTTLSVCLDKSLAKQILRGAGIDTPRWQLMVTGKEKLKAMRFPLIVKPNTEGTSKGITSASVVHDEQGLRAVVRTLLERYRQPALIEEYIAGREFTIGILGERRPRVLPPMEIVFLNAGDHPVYGFEEKKEYTSRTRFDCPATLTPIELKRLEKTARDTFIALDCRDVARADFRMAPDGTVHVIEVNPLPGLTPDYSDLCMIAKQAGLDHKALIGEILSGAIKRFQHAQAAALATPPKAAPSAPAPPTSGNTAP